MSTEMAVQLKVGVGQRGRRDREKIVFQTNGIQMAVFVKFVEFVAALFLLIGHEFHENDRRHLDVIGLKYNFFALSPAALPGAHF